MPTHRTRSGVTAGHPSLTPPVLAPGKRTVSQALRVMGLASSPGFARYHEVLNRARWDGRTVACALLVRMLGAFFPSGEVVLGVDDTIEHRWGLEIKARGLYHDPVRSSRDHFVRASGLRWLSLMVMVPIPWTGGTRRWSTGRARPSYRRGAGCRTAASSWWPTPAFPASA